MPTLVTSAFGNNTYFGYMQGESDGYLFKSNTDDNIYADVQSMLSENADLSIKSITYGNGMWFVFGQHTEGDIEDRDFVLFDSYEDFEAGVADKIKNQQRPRLVHCHGDKWAAYFEGKLYGKCSTAICETNDDLLNVIATKIGDEGYSLQAITFGDEVWYCVFVVDPDDDQGDANWALNSVYNKENEASFIASVEKHMDDDLSMRIAAFGNGVWFGYWEGEVKDGDGFAWQSHPGFDSFIGSVKEQWEADDEENESNSAANRYSTDAPTQSSTSSKKEEEASSFVASDVVPATKLSAKELKTLAAIKGKEEKEMKKLEAAEKKKELAEQKEHMKLEKRRTSEQAKLEKAAAKAAKKNKAPEEPAEMGDDDV